MTHYSNHCEGQLEITAEQWAIHTDTLGHQLAARLISQQAVSLHLQHQHFAVQQNPLPWTSAAQLERCRLSSLSQQLAA